MIDSEVSHKKWLMMSGTVQGMKQYFQATTAAVLACSPADARAST
jgi:hypothetical protein